VTHPLDLAPRLKRAETGIPGLDPLIDGGFPDNRAIALCGGAGTGKTTFALQFVSHGLELGEPAIFLSVDEKPRHLFEAADSLGLGLEDAAKRGVFVLLDAAPFFTATRGKSWTRSGLDARDVAGDLAQQIRKVGARRLVIDSITSLVPPEMQGAHTHDYLRSVVQSLEDNLNCSVLLTCASIGDDPQGICRAVRTLAAGILELRLRRSGSRLVRTLGIRKMRCTQFELAEYPVTIDWDNGLSIQEPEAYAGRAPKPAPVLASRQAV
jgi:KaiC/GvpD/RAD55 family RecA-like ATPase